MAEPLSFHSQGPSSLQLAQFSLRLQHQQPDFVTKSDAHRYRCPVHLGLLNEPLQTVCGHRLCRSCVDTYLAGKTSRRCPVGDSDCTVIRKDQVWPDNSIARDILKAMIFCTNKKAGCHATLQVDNLEAHLLECEFEPVPCVYVDRGCQERVERRQVDEHIGQCPCRPLACPSCGLHVNHRLLPDHEDKECPEKVTGCPHGCGHETLKRREIDSHTDICPMQPVDCKFKHMGCEYTGKRELVERHEKKGLAQHLVLIAAKASRLEACSSKTKDKINKMGSENDKLQTVTQSLQGENKEIQKLVHQFSEKIKDIEVKIVSAMERVITIEHRMPAVDRIEQQLDEVRTKLADLERRRGERLDSAPAALNASTGELSSKVLALDRQMGLHDVKIAEMDLRFQLLETAAYDGTLIWKIRDFRRRKNDAIHNRTLSLYSQPFYSHNFGYKMCARIYLNGDGMGKGSHLSLFFVIMQGEYDPLMAWPFRHKVSMTLLDQSPGHKHMTESFQPDPSSSSFQKPTSEMNVASGCPLFVSHSILENENKGYLKDDSIFIRIVVGCNHRNAPF